MINSKTTSKPKVSKELTFFSKCLRKNILFCNIGLVDSHVQSCKFGFSNMQFLRNKVCF